MPALIDITFRLNLFCFRIFFVNILSCINNENRNFKASNCDFYIQLSRSVLEVEAIVTFWQTVVEDVGCRGANNAGSSLAFHDFPGLYTPVYMQCSLTFVTKFMFDTQGIESLGSYVAVKLDRKGFTTS